ncbi:VOC family protein [Sediminimonas sp.]|uniref:VOC family protein n=1 Tax=Sediminimonas sp. TaxID=2823379 RepID=UPI0025EEE419|nr:VOC family protein [Sediminimonas sp.]
MTYHINGLHHVTALASDAQTNNDFFTRTLGLRRVKKTVNFDAPQVYHLYYGDRTGTPGTVITHFPFPHTRRGQPGTGEVGETAFAVPKGALDYWQARLSQSGVAGLTRSDRLGEARLCFAGPDGEALALVETDDARAPWTGADVPEAHAIRGFHSVTMCLAEADASAALLARLGYVETGREGAVTRYALPDGGNGAGRIDIEHAPDTDEARQGAGSVHHIAFSVPDRDAQDAARRDMLDAGYQVTPPIDRDYFWAIYFRSPGGVLFEIATDVPGFDRDEDIAHLGEALKLPRQHAHLRAELEQRHLAPLSD